VNAHPISQADARSPILGANGTDSLGSRSKLRRPFTGESAGFIPARGGNILQRKRLKYKGVHNVSIYQNKMIYAARRICIRP
jgi:hypothetical protein